MLTDKQKMCIMLIERYTGKIFNGTDFEEAQDFISRYIDISKEMSLKPTDKQIKCVNFICKKNNIKHNCKTKKDYYIFINNYIGDYIK